VTFTQPAAGGGEAVTLTSALAVKAPLPTISSTSPVSVHQGDSGVTLTVDGTGFRSGGVISVSGTGLTLGATSIVSATQATVGVTVALAATFGTRDVTFTQPAGGAATPSRPRAPSP